MAEEKPEFEVRWQDEEKKPPPPSGKNIEVTCSGGKVWADRELLRKCIPFAAHIINRRPSTDAIEMKSVTNAIMAKIIDLLKNGSVICPMEELNDFAKALRILAVHQFNVDRRQSKVAVKIAHICPGKTESTIQLRADNTVKEANRDILVERSGYFEQLLKDEYGDTVDVPEVEYEHLCWVVEITHANSVDVRTWTKDAQPSQFEDFCDTLEAFNIGKGSRQPVSQRDTSMPSQSESCADFSTQAVPSRKPRISSGPKLSKVAGHYPEAESSPKPRRTSGFTIPEKYERLARSGLTVIPGFLLRPVPSSSGRDVGSSSFQRVSKSVTDKPLVTSGQAEYSPRAGTSQKHGTTPKVRSSRHAELRPVPLFPSKLGKVSKSVTDKPLVKSGEAEYSPRAGTSQKHGTTPRVRSSRHAELRPIPFLFSSKLGKVSETIDLDEEEMTSPLDYVCSRKAGTQKKAEPSSVKEELLAKSADQSRKSAGSSPKSVGPSSKSPCPSPKGASPSPKGACPSPKGACPSPKGACPSPKGACPSPKGACPSPKGACPSPKGACPSPKGACPSPKGACPSPKGACPSPKGACPSPKGACPSPKGACPSPKGACPSPKGACPSPKGACPSPKGACPSPKGACPSPKGACSSPKGACPSAKGACPSAKGACPSPKGACPSAKGACPSAKGACPSAKGACPSAKGACPSAKGACPSAKGACPSAKGACPSPKKD